MVVQNKVYGLMGFAARSRNLVTGYNTCLKLIPSGKIKLLIIANDVGENTSQKLSQKCQSYNVPVVRYGTCEEISKATGKEDKGLFGLTDKGFAESIMREVEKENKNNKEREVF